MENSQLKLNAKSVLKSTYWMSFLALWSTISFTVHVIQ